MSGSSGQKTATSGGWRLREQVEIGEAHVGDGGTEDELQLLERVSHVRELGQSGVVDELAVDKLDRLQVVQVVCCKKGRRSARELRLKGPAQLRLTQVLEAARHDARVLGANLDDLKGLVATGRQFVVVVHVVAPVLELDLGAAAQEPFGGGSVRPDLLDSLLVDAMSGDG